MLRTDDIGNCERHRGDGKEAPKDVLREEKAEKSAIASPCQVMARADGPLIKQTRLLQHSVSGAWISKQTLTGQPANCLILKCVKTSPPLCEICWRVWIFLKSPGVVLFRSDNYLFKQRPCPSLPLFKYSTQPWYRTHSLPITKCYQLWGPGKAYCILIAYLSFSSE